jgi:hypothetical protein
MSIARKCMLVALTVSMAATTAAAQAQEVAKPAVVVVTLKDGSLFQGELVERVPGDHVTLRLATGAVRRFEASVIAPETDPGPLIGPLFRRPDVRPMVLSLTGVMDPLVYTGPDAVRLHIESNWPYRTYLFQAAAGGPSVGWNRLCFAPCDVNVDPKGTYKIGGASIADSDSFNLSGKPKQTLYVNAGSAGMAAMGWLSLVLGVGLTVPAVYFLTKSQDPQDEPGPNPNKIVGWVLLANGVPWLVAGAIVIGAAGTSVKSDDGTHIAQAPVPRGIDLGSGFHLTAHGVTF